MNLRDLLMSAVAIGILVLLIAFSDDRMRERMNDINSQSLSNTVATESARVGSATGTVRDLAMENGVLATVVVAGAVLFFFMLKT